jgi:histidyl-tRNA synthetase
MGDVVITLILQENGLVPVNAGHSPADVLVTVFDAERLPASLSLAAELRRAGLKVNCYPEPAKLPKQFKFADRMGIPYAIVIGPDEAVQGNVTIKDLAAGEQQTLPQSQAAQVIKKLLASRKSS